MRPTDIEVALARLADPEVMLPAMVWGSPGIGKSSVVHQIGKKNNRKVFDIRLALLDPTDLRGIPFYNPETKTAQWAPASILPKSKDDNFENLSENLRGVIEADQDAIVFLDEINAAPPVIQAAAYQLVLDRRIGDYHLPSGVSIIAAGNREGDKAVTFKMPTPLLNRFVHLDFDIHFSDWHDWAIQNRIAEDVVGFLNFKEGLLNVFDPKSSSRGFPTPRTWEYTSRLLSGNLSDAVLRGLVAGAVGEGAAIEFMTYREVYLTLPNVMDILDGKITRMPSDFSLSAAYAMITSLGYKLKAIYDDKGRSPEFFNRTATYFEFIHDNFKPEFCVMGVRDCLKNLKLPVIQAPNWKKFAKSYTKLVMAA